MEAGGAFQEKGFRKSYLSVVLTLGRAAFLMPSPEAIHWFPIIQELQSKSAVGSQR